MASKRHQATFNFDAGSDSDASPASEQPLRPAGGSQSEQQKPPRRGADPQPERLGPAAVNPSESIGEGASIGIRDSQTDPSLDSVDLRDRLVIVVDSHSLIYQVFHALPPMTSPQGEPVGAIHGFLGDIIELVQRFQPAFLFCAFDRSEETFRNSIFPEYKAHRDPMPPELRQQIPVIHEVLPAFGAAVLDCVGYEADDILATVAARVEAGGGRCLIVTADKDCRQLITDRVLLYNIRKQETFGRDELMATWGIAPEQVVDFQTLVGDPVDNIPGVPLIGPKLAQELLSKYGTLEKVFEHAHELAGPKRRQNLIDGREQAMMSRQLVKLCADVPCPLPWEAARPTHADPTRIEQLCEGWGFRRLRQRAREVLGSASPSVAETQPVAEWQSQYRVAASRDELSQVVVACRSAGRIAVDTETTGTNPRASEAVGISLAWAPGEAVYIPLRAPTGETVADRSVVIELLRPLLEDETIAKVGQNLKFDMIVLRGLGIELKGLYFDTMMADYLLDPGQRNHSLDELSKRYLEHQTIPISDLIGSGRNQRCMDEVPLAQICPYAAEDADVPWRLTDLLLERLREVGLEDLYRQVELPLIDVLVDMEYEGIYVDVDRLSEMSRRFTEQIELLYAKIQEWAGGSLNPDSPKQLSEVLFQKLGLRVVKRTKTGNSTDAEVLQTLASEHPLPELILRYRQWTKLKNTYVDALPLLVNPKTNRVHTSLRQDVAATGRLSSSEPNLQNIPIRTEEGRAIRSAFRAGRPDWLLLSADYSQIELRVLAHYCQDPALIDAYTRDQDIHARVASEVFGVSESEVTSDMRRTAKTINFGIVYGQSPFGLAKTLGIEKGDAAAYIRAYFDRYPGVLQFMRDTLASCRRNGYVQTILGRRRYLQGIRDLGDISDGKQFMLTESERMAVNTVIQGSAADLIKLAMIRLRRTLQHANLEAKMLLQIHDELLFETSPAAKSQLASLVRQEMTSAIELRVPLKVEVKSGPSWAECEP